MAIYAKKRTGPSMGRVGISEKYSLRAKKLIKAMKVRDPQWPKSNDVEKVTTMIHQVRRRRFISFRSSTGILVFKRINPTYAEINNAIIPKSAIFVLNVSMANIFKPPPGSHLSPYL